MNQKLREELELTNQQAEKRSIYMVLGLFLFGLAIAFHYDTWKLALGVGGSSVLVFLVAKFFYSGTLFFRMVISALMGFFMLQFVAQLHGMLEMHFWFFILPMMLIYYRDWRLFLPLGIIVSVHHFGIFYLYMQGNDEYMVYLFDRDRSLVISFIYHMILAVLGILVGMWMATRLRNESVSRIMAGISTSEQLKEIEQLTKEVKKIASEITSADDRAHDDEKSVGELLSTVGQDFSKTIHSLIDETREVVVLAGMEGNLSAQMSLEGKSGNWLQMADAINSLLQSVSIPIVRVTKIARQMAEGDLTLRYDISAQGDIKEFADNLNKGLDKLTTLLSQIVEEIQSLKFQAGHMMRSGKEMKGAIEEIVSAITEMNQGTSRQLNRIENLSDLMDEARNTSHSLQAKTTTVMESVRAGNNNSEEGKQIAKEVVADMERISDYSRETNESIRILEERSNEISRVLGIITGISSQTNLLALNAAIEAAQAGESGRGFAVVAEEIRKLAEGSRKSAQEIEKLVNDVKRDTENASKVIAQMDKSVQNGVSSTFRAEQAFNQISESTSSSLELSEEIQRDFSQQLDRMNKAVEEIESVVVISQETAAGTEQVNSSANQLSSGMNGYMETTEQLNEMAKELYDSIGQFKLARLEENPKMWAEKAV